MSASVIVAHGLWMPGIETRLLCRRLRSAGFSPFLFRFQTLRGTLQQNTAQLGRFFDATPGEPVHIVGYSLGGIVALSLVRQAVPARLGRIVCLGSPLTGSRTARRLAKTGIGRAVVGRSLHEHDVSGGFERWEAAVDLGIIAGSRRLGVGRLVGALTGEHDGTVAVEETRLPGMRAHITLPVTHTQMLFDQTVARQTIHFLHHGSFAA